MNGEYSVAVANEVKAKARNPTGDAKELVDMVITYAKQETLEPLKGLGKKAALGVGGAVLLGDRRALRLHRRPASDADRDRLVRGAQR